MLLSNAASLLDNKSALEGYETPLLDNTTMLLRIAGVLLRNTPMKLYIFFTLPKFYCRFSVTDHLYLIIFS